MKTFEYRGYDPDGYLKKGLIEAMDAKDAREKLAQRGVLADRLAAVGNLASRGLLKGDPLTVSFRTLLYRELAALLGAGVPLVKALDILIQSPETGPARNILASVRDKIREGSAFGDALGRSGRSVKPFGRTAVIAVGEKSATLDVVLDRLAAFLEEQEQLRERIKSAMIYPSIVLAFAFCVAVVMLGVVIPSAGRLLQEAHVALPALTRTMMKAGRVVIWAGPLGALLAAAVVASIRRRCRADASFRRALDRRLFDLPLFGRGYAVLVNLRFARTLSILLHGGVGLVEGLALAGRATGSPWVENRLETEAEAVRHGSSVADAVRRVNPLSSTLPSWIETGEASGALEKLLDNAGDRYQYQWNQFVARCLSLLEPALILFVGLIVLLVALSILLPVISLNRSIGG